MIRLLDKPARLSVLDFLYYAGDERFGALAMTAVIPGPAVVIPDPAAVIPDSIRDPLPRHHWIADQVRNDSQGWQ